MRRLVVLFSVLAIFLSSAPLASAVAPNAKPGGPHAATASRIVGYFISWGIYGRNFWVRDLIDNGSAPKLTTLNYAFGNVAPDDSGKVVCKLGDEWADYQTPIAPEHSVTGQEVTWPQPILGNFHEFKALKALYPNVRVNISLGGWTWSKYFSDAALTKASREAFVRSCVDLFIKGNLPDPGWGGMGGPGAAAGVFDGIDLDWEWPGSEGNTGNIIRAADKQNFTHLVREFRHQLDAYGRKVHKHYELSAFLPASESAIDAGFEVHHLMKLFDFATVQGYDLAGPWDLSATNHHSQLYSPSDDPQGFSVDTTMDQLRARGAPANKLVMGLPFYGHGWTGVTNANNGLYQPATAPAAGTWEAGSEDYHVLKTLTGSGYTRYWDADAMVPWLFNGTTFWSYDDPQSIAAKTAYINANHLGGVMVWELTSDTSDGELMTAIHDGLNP